MNRVVPNSFPSQLTRDERSGRGAGCSDVPSTSTPTCSNIARRTHAVSSGVTNNRIVYAKNGIDARKAYDELVAKWTPLAPAVVRSLEEAGNQLLTFYEFPRARPVQKHKRTLDWRAGPFRSSSTRGEPQIRGVSEAMSAIRVLRTRGENTVQQRDATLPGRRPGSRSWAKMDIKEARATPGPERARPATRQ